MALSDVTDRDREDLKRLTAPFSPSAYAPALRELYAENATLLALLRAIVGASDALERVTPGRDASDQIKALIAAIDEARKVVQP
jgi:hypothetical protein